MNTLLTVIAVSLAVSLAVIAASVAYFVRWSVTREQRAQRWAEDQSEKLIATLLASDHEAKATPFTGSGTDRIH